MNFYEEHKADRDRFEIVAFHDTKATDINDLTEKLTKKKVIEKLWNGKMLPFPIAFDTTGETLKKYGIHFYPTVVLIDPRGKLAYAGLDAHEVLAKKLRETRRRAL